MNSVTILIQLLLIPTVDRDADGLLDLAEQKLLEQFRPSFLLSSGECDLLPAEFAPGESHPRPIARNGTLYGQATPRPGDRIELRYFHLWARDCGRIAHDLDAERVSALLDQDPSGEWTASAWYASAHEGTACDVSSLARAPDPAPSGAVRVSTSRAASTLRFSTAAAAPGDAVATFATGLPQ